jgi:hypothetical protein
MSPLSWTFEHQANLLVVHVEGEWHVEELLAMLDEAAERCRDAGYERVLADFRRVRGTVAELSKYLIGTRIAEVLKTIKLAAVGAPSAVITGFTERIAANRGGRLFVTKSIDEARQWLFE